VSSFFSILWVGTGKDNLLKKAHKAVLSSFWVGIGIEQDLTTLTWKTSNQDPPSSLYEKPTKKRRENTYRTSPRGDGDSSLAK